HDDFAHHIYNDEYHLVDPDFASLRPQNNSNWLGQLFSAQRPARTLDYGGGNGLLAEALRAKGFADVHVYDPFVSEHAARPQGTFDLISSFEVLEHSTTPLETMRDMVSLLSTPGVIVFSTLLRGGPAVNEGINWWYIGPRNGHASIYSPQSLQRMIGSFGMTCGSFNAGLHIAFRELPLFAGHLMLSPAPPR
ncbi:MAG TPA: class I SAM-dependent methyltransferase, partial [Tepidisphaeraceae bacterium]|nr:class I SAM-dependent methyltransferase [Tepidisphaeraceae bacterium]